MGRRSISLGKRMKRDSAITPGNIMNVVWIQTDFDGRTGPECNLARLLSD
jgi:hypothetical protein